jgi:hypothetical protein
LKHLLVRLLLGLFNDIVTKMAHSNVVAANGRSFFDCISPVRHFLKYEKGFGLRQGFGVLYCRVMCYYSLKVVFELYQMPNTQKGTLKKG